MSNPDQTTSKKHLIKMERWCTALGGSVSFKCVVRHRTLGNIIYYIWAKDELDAFNLFLEFDRTGDVTVLTYGNLMERHAVRSLHEEINKSTNQRVKT